MTISAIALLSVFLGLFGVLLIIALVHLIQGMRFGGSSTAMVTTSFLFLGGIIFVAFGAWFFLRSVDWEQPFMVNTPFVRVSTEPQ